MKKIKKHFLSNADILIFFFSVLFFDYYFRNQLGMSSANAKVIFVNIFKWAGYKKFILDRKKEDKYI